MLDESGTRMDETTTITALGEIIIIIIIGIRVLRFDG